MTRDERVQLAVDIGKELLKRGRTAEHEHLVGFWICALRDRPDQSEWPDTLVVSLALELGIRPPG